MADGELNFTGVEAAVGQTTIYVVPALAGGIVDVAADVVQAVARVISAAYHFDMVDIEWKNHVDKALVAAVDVARNTVDQHLDAVDVALAIERTKSSFAGLGALAGLGQLDTGHLSQQLPAVHYVLVFYLITAQDIDRSEYVLGAQSGTFLLRNAYLSQSDG